MIEIKVTGAESRWLDTRGGRRARDVFLDEQGEKYVLMGDGKGGEKRVYLLSDNQ